MRGKKLNQRDVNRVHRLHREDKYNNGTLDRCNDLILLVETRKK